MQEIKITTDNHKVNQEKVHTGMIHVIERERAGDLVEEGC
jgi:predicted neutral ceramidase superfamily lipid hydrolase